MSEGVMTIKDLRAMLDAYEYGDDVPVQVLSNGLLVPVRTIIAAGPQLPPIQNTSICGREAPFFVLAIPMTPMRLTVPEVIPDIQELYDRSPVGCCLHIVLDDENVSDDHIRFCLTEAVKAKHPKCYELGAKLLSMSRTQRLKLARAKHCIAPRPAAGR
jgi:hypothetical protein